MSPLIKNEQSLIDTHDRYIYFGFGIAILSSITFVLFLVLVGTNVNKIVKE